MAAERTRSGSPGASAAAGGCWMTPTTSLDVPSAFISIPTQDIRTIRPFDIVASDTRAQPRAPTARADTATERRRRRRRTRTRSRRRRHGAEAEARPDRQTVKHGQQRKSRAIFLLGKSKRFGENRNDSCVRVYYLLFEFS